MTLILERLYLGGLTDAKRFAKEPGYAYVCLTPETKQELPHLFQDGDNSKLMLFKLIPDEVQRANEMKGMLPDCTSFVAQQLAAGRSILVFCKWGQSRSATVVIDYLMTKLGYTLRKAFWHVRGLRKIAFPNVGFFQLLQEKDMELHGRLSMPESRGDYLAINAKKRTKPKNGLAELLNQACFPRPAPQTKEPIGGICLAEHPAERGIWQVATRLFIGDEASANNQELVLAKKIERMLSLVPAHQGKPHWADESGIQYKGVSLPEDVSAGDETMDMQQLWKQCHDFLSAGKLRNTLVFCHHGHSRSSTIIISYLMIKKRYTLHHAFWSVRQRHETCFPNIGYFQELQKLEMKLLGRATMPYESEEYEALRNHGHGLVMEKPRVMDAFSKKMWKLTGKMGISSAATTSEPTMRQLYGPLGLQLGDKVSMGDLALVTGLKELPTHRCLMVAGTPQYCRDQSQEVCIDIYEVPVLTPVPLDTVHQVRVATRMILMVIAPETYLTYMADEQHPENESLWHELKFYTSPFHGKDIDEERMLQVMEAVQKAPCASAGEERHKRPSKDNLVRSKPSASEIVDHWEEMMESPFSAPVRVWQKYLWDQRKQAREDEKADDHANDAEYTELIDRIMPLDEDCVYDDVKFFLRNEQGLWTRLDLRKMETRYTKHEAATLKKKQYGSCSSVELQEHVENFKQGQTTVLLDKVLGVGRLKLLVLSHLGSGKSGAAYRVRILPNKEIPVWLEDQEAVLKVARGMMQLGSDFEAEATIMKKVPASVPHCIRYLDSGTLRAPHENHGFMRSVSMNFGMMTAAPFALVMTLAGGVTISKALNGKLGRDDRLLWFMIDQLLSFSVGMEELGAYHGDMTLENALWDDDDHGELTFIDFGNAGLTKEDPFHRTQRAGCLAMLSAIKEVLERTPDAPAGPGTCLSWLQFLHGEPPAKTPTPATKRASHAEAKTFAAAKQAMISCKSLRESFRERLPARTRPHRPPPLLDLQASGDWRNASFGQNQFGTPQSWQFSPHPTPPSLGRPQGRKNHLGFLNGSAFFGAGGSGAEEGLRLSPSLDSGTFLQVGGDSSLHGAATATSSHSSVKSVSVVPAPIPNDPSLSSVKSASVGHVPIPNGPSTLSSISAGPSEKSKSSSHHEGADAVLLPAVQSMHSALRLPPQCCASELLSWIREYLQARLQWVRRIPCCP
mmetsp:Transcript_68374/g.164095  ORF Transcript_68374/g.164095 Transcript_68374/m.164095 type:complete len:1189 (-) Transcript_68374:172-3738(-)